MGTDLTEALKQILKTNVQECDLPIELAAQLFNTSKRSLQRKLSENGTRYCEVVDQVRFEAASDMLRNPETTVTDVAHNLGYSDSAHFSRAFRRMSGVSPRVYREQVQATG